MVNWLKWLGGGKDDAAPKLDPPDVTAARVDAKRRKDLADWQAAKARDPHILDRKITHKDYVAVLRDSGYRARRIMGEAIYVKTGPQADFAIFARLKTLGDGDYYAPSQRFALSGYVSDHLAAKVSERLFSGETAVPATAYGAPIEVRWIIVTHAQVQEAVAAMDAALAALDIEAALAEHRAFSPSKPGSAGLSHLVALVLAGEVETLLDYDHARSTGRDAGFVPYITDAMIAEALALGYIAQESGRDGLAAHLA